MESTVKRGELASAFGWGHLELKVLKSAAGYYLGTFCPEEGPISRESQYFASKAEAQQALDTNSWIQRLNP